MKICSPVLKKAKKKKTLNTKWDWFPPVSNNLFILGKISWCFLPNFPLLPDEDWSINWEDETDCKSCQAQINPRGFPFGWVHKCLFTYAKYILWAVLSCKHWDWHFLHYNFVSCDWKSGFGDKRNPGLGTLRLQTYKLRSQQVPGYPVLT